MSKHPISHRISKPAAITHAGQEKSTVILLLIALVVLGLHLGVYKLVRRVVVSTPANNSAVPFKLEVALLQGTTQPTAQQSSITKPTAPKPTSKAPTEPHKAVDRSTDIAPPPRQQATDLAAIKEIINTQPPKQVARSVKSTADASITQAVSAYMFHSQPKTPRAKDNFPESDEHNPSPEYPEEAIFLGYQGAAIIKIQVSGQGASSAVSLAHSSGHKLLDNAAVNALKQWRFTATHHASEVIIVVNYLLR